MTRTDKILGKGKFGEVWKGDLDREPLALKCLAKETLDNRDNKTALEDEGQRIQ